MCGATCQAGGLPGCSGSPSLARRADDDPRRGAAPDVPLMAPGLRTKPPRLRVRETRGLKARRAGQPGAELVRAASGPDRCRRAALIVPGRKDWHRSFGGPGDNQDLAVAHTQGDELPSPRRNKRRPPACLQDIFRRASLSNEGDRPALVDHPEALVYPASSLSAGRARGRDRSAGPDRRVRNHCHRARLS